LKLVFDIETTAYHFGELSESQQEYLLRYADREADDTIREIKTAEAKRYLNLYPLTAKVCSLALFNIHSQKMYVMYEGVKGKLLEIPERNLKYAALPEREIIEMFWNYAGEAEQLISFNGRNFDLPFLMIRSAMLKIKPSRNFLRRKYHSKTHVDLLEKFTYFGLTKKFNLDFYCHAFGIESPKSNGITGMDINELYRSGKIKEIAVYCAEDVRATYELYKIWNDYLNI
jgi:predicted PolB exonuclease-like 3'-5' exonuclease